MYKTLAIVGIVGALVFALWLGITRYGASQYDAGVQATAAKVNAATAQGAIAAAQSYAQGVKDSNAQSTRFLDWQANTFTPTKETISHEIRTFIQSPAGAVRCLDAAGVRQTNDDIIRANALAATPATSGSTSGVSGTALAASASRR